MAILQPKLITPEARDFAPGLLAIQESPPPRLPRVVMYTVGVLFVILLLWAFFGKLDIIASAEGRLVPQTYVKIVQPADAGIVEEILVKEGEHVAAGQVLLRMDMKPAQADEKSIAAELELKSLELRRVNAELNGKPMAKAERDSPDLYGQVEAQFGDRRKAYVDALGEAQDRLNKARREYDSALEVLQKLHETVPILKQQAEAYTEMGKDGYAPLLTVHDKEREYLERARDLSAQQATVASLSAAVAAAEKEVSQITSKYRSDLQNERVEAQGKYLTLKQDWIKQEHKTGLLELRAPQAGVVKDLATHTVGTVVSPGTVLLTLVPEQEPLVAEVMVKNDDVGFVYPQQAVKVKLSPYPFEKYGMLDGEVLTLSADASDSEASSSQTRNSNDANHDKPTQTLAYKALIALKQQTLDAQGQSFKLAPGMQVVAEINQGRRSVMEYLLSPVQKTLQDAGHER